MVRIRGRREIRCRLLEGSAECTVIATGQQPDGRRGGGGGQWKDLSEVCPHIMYISQSHPSPGASSLIGHSLMRRFISFHLHIHCCARLFANRQTGIASTQSIASEQTLSLTSNHLLCKWRPSNYVPARVLHAAKVRAIAQLTVTEGREARETVIRKE